MDIRSALLALCAGYIAVDPRHKRLVMQKFVVSWLSAWITNSRAVSKMRRPTAHQPNWCPKHQYNFLQLPSKCIWKYRLKMTAILFRPPCINLHVFAAIIEDGRRCQLPFTYNGMTYMNCTGVGNNGRAWCSLQRNHTTGAPWGNCKDISCMGGGVSCQG